MLSKKKITRSLALVAMLAVILATLAGCGQKDEAGGAADTAATGVSEEGGNTVYVVLCGPYVNEEKLGVFADTLREALPGLTSGGNTIDVSGITVGDTETDPMFAAGGMMQLTGRMATGEVDLLIADPSNGARNARSEAFVQLSALSGLADTAGREIVFKAVDEEGNETNEELPPYGVRLDGNEELAEAMPGSEIGAYVVDTDNEQGRAAAVEIINYLLGTVDG